MIRDISKTWEVDKSGPDVQPYRRYHVINDISSHQSKDKPRLVLDKAPWAPLPRSISGDGHHVIIGSSRRKSPSSGLPRGSSLPGSPSSSRSPSSHLKVPHQTLSLASHDSRKTRGKWKNPSKRNHRQLKRLNDSLRRSSVKSQSDKIDFSSRTKISSGLALSAIAILLAI